MNDFRIGKRKVFLFFFLRKDVKFGKILEKDLIIKFKQIDNVIVNISRNYIILLE